MEAWSAKVAVMVCLDESSSPGRLFRGVWTRLPGVMRGVVEGGGARSAGKRTAPSLTMVSADWRGTERGKAGPAVMTRSSRLRVCWGSRARRDRRSGSLGSSGPGSRATRAEGCGACAPPLLRPVPTSPRRSSRMVGRRLACRDAAALLGPLKCGWTTYVPLDHLVHEIRWSNRTQVVQRNLSGPSRRAPP